MNYKKITLVQIEYFLAVARYLNFTEASKSLYVSQPSLSKQIAILEDSIGIELFFRNKRDVKLTAAGAVLLREIGGVIDIIESSIEKTKRADLCENSTITIGCLDAIDVSRILLPVIKAFKKQNPKINIVLERYSFKVLREKFINGSLDIVFTLSFEMDEAMNTSYSVMSRGNICVVMEESNPLAKKQKLLFKDLKKQEFIVISRDECPNGYDSLISIARKNGFTPKIVKQLPNIESLLLSIEANMGIAILDSNVKIHNNHNIKVFQIEDGFIDVIMTWKEEKSYASSLLINYILINIEDRRDKMINS